MNRLQEALTIINIPETLHNPKLAKGLERYTTIMNKFHADDFSADRGFQRKFNGFYRIMCKPAKYYTDYYQYLTDHRSDVTLDFPTVLKHFHDKFGSIEKSFSSKLLHTIKSDSPIWDSKVLAKLKLKAPKQNSSDKLNETIAIYTTLCEIYKDASKTAEWEIAVKQFNTAYPNSKINEVKKIDFILWAS
jgi:hypothetical protein